MNTSSYTLDELDEQIRLTKEQLKGFTQSAAISPSAGGTQRQWTKIDRVQLLKELRHWEKRRAALLGAAPRRGILQHSARLDGGGQVLGGPGTGADPYGRRR